VGTVKHDITVQQGAKFVLSIAAQNADKSVMNLSGYTGRMQIRDAAGGASTYLDATSANGMIAVNGPAGVVTVTVGADVTDPMTWKNGVYDLEVTNGATNVIRLAEGFASFSAEVTQP